GGQVVRAAAGDVLAGEGGAVDAVLAGGAAHDVHGVARAVAGGADHLVRPDDAHAHGVHQGIGGVAGIGEHLAAEHGHAEGIAVVTDALYRSAHMPAAAGGV